MELFIILLTLGILLFVGSFKFLKVDIIFLLNSALVFILLGVGLFSGAVDIPIDSKTVYVYDNLSSSSPNLLEEQTQETLLNTSYPMFHTFLKYFFVLFGLYLFFISLFEVRSRK